MGASPLRILSRTRDDLARRGRRELESEGFSLAGLAANTFLEMRYAGQSYELSVPVDSLASDTFLPAFHAAHDERYGHSDATRAVEVVTLRLKLVLPAPGGPAGASPKHPGGHKTPANAQRYVWFEAKPTLTPIYGRAQLRPGVGIAGPAIVVQMDSTTAVPPDWRAAMDAMRNVVLEPA